MKNKFQFIATLAVILSVSLGCGFVNRGSSKTSEPGQKKTLTDKAIDKTVGESKIGVPECDEVMDEIEAELNNSDDNIFVKAGKATFLNRIKDSIRDSVKENKADTVELAKTCREFKTQLDKYKEEEQTNKDK